MQIMDTNNKIINGFLDMSSFLLVEGTADSEADCVDNMAYDEDDAESCSCEYTSESNHTLPNHLTMTVDQMEHHSRSDYSLLRASDQEVLILDHEVDEQFSSEYSNGDREGEERWKGYKMWLRDYNANLRAIDDEDEAESKNGINLSREVMDQMEDWLFWETCMAVGYP